MAENIQEYIDKYEQNVDILDDDAFWVNKARLEGLKAFKKHMENFFLSTQHTNEVHVSVSQTSRKSKSKISSTLSEMRLSKITKRADLAAKMEMLKK